MLHSLIRYIHLYLKFITVLRKKMYSYAIIVFRKTVLERMSGMSYPENLKSSLSWNCV